MTEQNILVVFHSRRDDTVAAAIQLLAALHNAGARPVMVADDFADFASAQQQPLTPVAILGKDAPAETIEFVIVLGGDGTILRAAELARTSSAPILGINMGHVGFLAESERDDMDAALQRVLAREYTIEERMALDVSVKNAAGEIVYQTFALNEVSIEKGSRERMLEVVIEVNRRPLTSYGCDGVVVATPTGSTAYNFSAGGPIIWPTLQAIAVVPLSAHALFTRPIVVDPSSSVAVELMSRTGSGVLWADGRRSHELPPGARVIARQSTKPVRLARLHTADFTDRLVGKFRLPVDGWRGPDLTTQTIQTQGTAH